MANSYIENFKSYTDWGTVIVRSNNTPLDRTSIFGSLDDAKKYAKGDASDKNKLGKTSYIGQFLAVHENGVVDVYQIIGDDTKTPKERALRRVIHEDDLKSFSGDTVDQLQMIIDKLISKEGTVYDCEKGTLTLSAKDETNTLVIPLTGNYGTFNEGQKEFNKNRLQFVHCDKLFETSEQAKEYVNGNLIVRDRPSLFAEPMVLKYGDAKNPNVLLAIGSVGDGESVDDNNKVFFIDFAKLMSDTNFEFIDTNTISFNVNKTENGVMVDSNVLLQPTKIINNVSYDNTILTDTNGIFSHINVDVINDNIVVNVNGNLKEYPLPEEIVKGTYNKETLKLTLFTKNNKEILIDFNDVVLISDNDGNIIKKREDGLYSSVELTYDPITDILTFNNGINGGKEINLLSKEQDEINKKVDESLTKLNLSSIKSNTVENIINKNDDGTTIKSDVILSLDSSNIIKATDNGLYANVNVDYNRAQNVLTFTTSNGSKEIQLSSHSLITNGSYDASTKSIILTVQYDTGNGSEIRTITIPVGDLVNVLNIENKDGSPITLKLEKDYNTGVDTLSAKLEISNATDNLLTFKKEGSTSNLYVRGHADAIKVHFQDAETVQDAFDKVQNENNTFNSKFQNVENEINSINGNLQSVENEIDDINDNLHSVNENLIETKSKLDITSNNLQTLENNLNNQLTNVKGDLNNLSNQLTNVEGELNNKLTNVEGGLSDLNNKLTNVEGDLNDKVVKITNDLELLESKIEEFNETISNLEDSISNDFGYF